MRFFLMLARVVVLVVFFAGAASAASWRVDIQAGDQAMARRQAAYRAYWGVSGHVGRCCGTFEGVGWGSHGVPGTCVPGRFMRLTGDACFRGRRGYYRVRCWRD